MHNEEGKVEAGGETHKLTVLQINWPHQGMDLVNLTHERWL